MDKEIKRINTISLNDDILLNKTEIKLNKSITKKYKQTITANGSNGLLNKSAVGITPKGKKCTFHCKDHSNDSHRSI